MKNAIISLLLVRNAVRMFFTKIKEKQSIKENCKRWLKKLKGKRGIKLKTKTEGKQRVTSGGYLKDSFTKTKALTHIFLVENHTHMQKRKKNSLAAVMITQKSYSNRSIQSGYIQSLSVNTMHLSQKWGTNYLKNQFHREKIIGNVQNLEWNVLDLTTIIPTSLWKSMKYSKKTIKAEEFVVVAEDLNETWEED